MREIDLPFPPNEQKFWQQVAYRWVKSPGFMVAIVPADLNISVHGFWVRDYALKLPTTDPAIKELIPALNDTLCWDLSNTSTQLIQIAGQEILPRALAEIDEKERAEEAARGETPFYLLLTGMVLPAETSLENWVRDVVKSWPGVRPATSLTQFHLCCVVTAPLPKNPGFLPEGCDWLIPDNDQEGEILTVVQDVVEKYWGHESSYMRSYIRSGIADMASGRRKHAELALELLLENRNHNRAQKTGRQLFWPTNSAPVQQTREVLIQEGLSSKWLQARLVGIKNESETSEVELARRLWARGLWRNRLENGGVWTGLTTLARAALKPLNIEDELDPLFLPHSTTFILNRCMQVEHQLKHLLWHLLETGRGRERLRQIFDASDGQKSAISFRERILNQVPEQRSRIPPEKLGCDEIAISRCSFGNLKETLMRMPSADRNQVLLTALNTLVWARNLAAHGGWFTSSEFIRVCEQADKAEQSLSRLRF